MLGSPDLAVAAIHEGVGMHFRFTVLLGCLAAACMACGSGPTALPTPGGSPTSAVTAVATESMTEEPTASPTPSPTIRTSGPAWTTKAVAVYPKATDDGAVQVNLGAAFPVTLTSKSATIEGVTWDEITWQTPGRHATGWLPAAAVTLTQPDGMAAAAIGALDEDLGEYLAKLGNRIGVVAYDVTRGVTYTYNPTRTYFVASSIKVPILLTFLTQLEAKKREPTAHEKSLMRTMIENSNNTSASALYAEIGEGKGLNAFMKSMGIKGLTPHVYGTPGSWGHSTISATTMVALLTKLHDGSVLNDAHRALALGYMSHIDSAGRAGIGDSSPKGAKWWMKDGWTTALDGTGTSVVNTSGIVTLGAETYILSVYTNGNRGFAAGQKIVRHVCSIVGDRLTKTP